MVSGRECRFGIASGTQHNLHAYLTRPILITSWWQNVFPSILSGFDFWKNKWYTHLALIKQLSRPKNLSNCNCLISEFSILFQIYIMKFCSCFTNAKQSWIVTKASNAMLLLSWRHISKTNNQTEFNALDPLFYKYIIAWCF